MEGQVIHHTGPTGFLLATLCLVALIVVSHGHNFKGKLGQNPQ